MANENKDIIRVFDTLANLPTKLINGQFGYETTNDRLAVKRLADGNMKYFDAIDSGDFLKADGSVQLTADWDTGDFEITNVSNIQINNADALQFTDAGATVRDVVTVDGGDDIYIGNTNLDDLYLRAGSGHSIYFQDGTTSNMIIDGSGNVGIGNDTPGRELEISDSASPAELEISTWSTTAAHKSTLVLQKSASATINTLSATAASEGLGMIQALGVDTGGTARNAVRVLFEGDAGPDADAVPGKITIQTSDDTGLQDALIIDDGQSIKIAGTGPHAIGGDAQNNIQLWQRGSFTSGGASSSTHGYALSTAITAANGDITQQSGAIMATSITTQSNSETIGDVAQLILNEPNITKGTDTITNASTLNITGAPTEGTNNYAILVDSGDVQIGGNLEVVGDGPHTLGTNTPKNWAQYLISGPFTSGGGASETFGLFYETTITAANGDTNIQSIGYFSGAMTTQSNSETIAHVSQLTLDEPSITKGTDTITDASTLLITGAPTEGANNWAILVESGDVGLNGDINLKDDNIIFLDTGENHMLTYDSGNSVVKLEAGTGTDAIEINSGDANLNLKPGSAKVDVYGDLTFNSDGDGLYFGEIYASEVTDTITISSSGKGNKVQVTSFDANGLSNGMTPDHTNDHITATAGMYLCTVSISCTSTGGSAYTMGFSVWKNNGATEFANCIVERSLSGGGSDTGSLSISGLIDLAANDTIELWCWNATNTNNIIIENVTLSLVCVGGT